MFRKLYFSTRINLTASERNELLRIRRNVNWLLNVNTQPEYTNTNDFYTFLIKSNDQLDKNIKSIMRNNPQL